MFIDNKYKRIYFSIQERAKQRDEIEVGEWHHIIPRSLGGNNSKENMVKLSPREHFISHALLIKMVELPKHRKSMAYAFVRMKTSNSRKYSNRIGNGRLYETIKKSIREEFVGENNPFYGDKRFSGENNPFYGKTHSEETRKKLSEVNRGKFIGENNPFYGKTHSEETKEIISSKQREPVIIVFEDGSRVMIEKKNDIGKHLGVSSSLGVMLCSTKRHLWSKYQIKEILECK